MVFTTKVITTNQDACVRVDVFVKAFAKTSLSYDRYLKAGDLYTGAREQRNQQSLYCDTLMRREMQGRIRSPP